MVNSKIEIKYEQQQTQQKIAFNFNWRWFQFIFNLKANKSHPLMHIYNNNNNIVYILNISPSIQTIDWYKICTQASTDRRTDRMEWYWNEIYSMQFGHDIILLYIDVSFWMVPVSHTDLRYRKPIRM